MSSAFTNKVVIITGGSDGIGKALVEKFIAAGAKVVTCARNHDKLYQLQAQHPAAPLTTMVADVSHENDCKRLIEMTLNAHSRIDILINNAGISMRAEVIDTTPEVIEKLMGTNFFGAVYCTMHALPHLLKTNGTIVGVSSIAGYRGLPGRSGYSASKFALQGWLESLRVELIDHDVNVMWVSPGYTSSNIRFAALTKDGSSQGSTPMDEEKMMSPEDCADRILQAVEKRKRTIVMTSSGKKAVLVSRLFPSLADKLIKKFYYKDGKMIK